MKRSAIFIATLLSNLFFACGFYPYGDDVRFYFLDPDKFSYQEYRSFYYSSLYFGYNNDGEEPEIKDSQNEVLWRKYCKNKVSIDEINFALEKYGFSDINEKSSNTFIKYLYSAKDNEAVDYLKFAKNCEFFNSWQEDPWERNENTAAQKRTVLLHQAIALASKTKNSEIRKRYAFLAVRLAFYNGDMKSLAKIYAQYFSVEKANDIIDIWALYFKAIEEKNQGLKNIYFSRVFTKCPEKRFVSWQAFDHKLSKEEVLQSIDDPKDKARVLMMYSIYNSGKNINNLKEIYACNSNFDGLGFLVSREISKLEDWIFTPYYSLFEPAIPDSGYISQYDQEYQSVRNVFGRVKADREYAKELLEFINSADLSKVQNPDFWKFAKAELLFMTKNYSESLKQISNLEKTLPADSKIRENAEQIKALNLFANQTYGKAVIPDAAKEIIIKNRKNERFIFALGRELEYLGNTDDAALLYASLDERLNSLVYFKSLKSDRHTYGDYFVDYFNYMDAVYSPEQVHSFIKKTEKVNSGNDLFFSNFKMKQQSVNNLYDLLGTKYIRQNKLNLALHIFKKLGAEYYEAQNTLWENDGKDSYSSSGKIFDQNPFYHLKYTPDFIEEREKFRVTKLSVTQKLIEYLGKANNPQEKDRDYYYFLVANCYYNMSQYGNAWMMRRYFVSSAGNFSIREDNEEFNTAGLAKLYYGKAMENAKTEKFKALCLRMQGRCENYNYDFNDEENSDRFSRSDDYEDRRLEKNRYYQDLKNKYAGQYEDMMSGCEFFEDYFKARR